MHTNWCDFCNTIQFVFERLRLHHIQVVQRLLCEVYDEWNIKDRYECFDGIQLCLRFGLAYRCAVIVRRPFFHTLNDRNLHIYRVPIPHLLLDSWQTRLYNIRKNCNLHIVLESLQSNKFVSVVHLINCCCVFDSLQNIKM